MIYTYTITSGERVLLGLCTVLFLFGAAVAGSQYATFTPVGQEALEPKAITIKQLKCSRSCSDERNYVIYDDKDSRYEFPVGMSEAEVSDILAKLAPGDTVTVYLHNSDLGAIKNIYGIVKNGTKLQNSSASIRAYNNTYLVVAKYASLGQMLLAAVAAVLTLLRVNILILSSAELTSPIGKALTDPESYRTYGAMGYFTIIGYVLSVISILGLAAFGIHTSLIELLCYVFWGGLSSAVGYLLLARSQRLLKNLKQLH
jgi:hypothetical protein